MFGQLHNSALRRMVSQSVLTRRLAAVLLGGCLLWSAGCCRQGLLLDFSIELNRVPWQAGCQHCGGGGNCGDSQGACASCKRRCRSSELAGGLVEEPLVIGRFFPVPTKPVFSQTAVAVEEIPPPQALKVRRPRPVPPEPDTDETSVAFSTDAR